MKSSNSPVPEALQWIPGVINWLDDCQDLLFTALVLARPLLTRLPAYWLPGLGWVLFANDILNVGTGVLAFALGGRSWKRASLDVMEKLVTGRTRRLSAVNNFFAASLFWPAIIQGGQALETLTGYGLQLGALMGLITDSFWGTLRSFTGSPIVIKKPPPADIFGKAARVLSQSHQLAYVPPILSREDLDLIIGATAMAQSVVGQALSTNRLFPRAKQAESITVPTFQVWQENSRDALELEGIKWEDDDSEDLKPYVATSSPFPQFGDALPLSAITMFQTERTMRQIYGPTNHGSAIALLYNQMTLDPWTWQSNGAPPFTTEFFEPEIDLSAAVEYGVWPAKTVDTETLRLWLSSARGLALQQGFTRASFESLKASANVHTEGWTRRTFSTFKP